MRVSSECDPSLTVPLPCKSMGNDMTFQLNNDVDVTLSNNYSYVCTHTHFLQTVHDMTYNCINKITHVIHIKEIIMKINCIIL